MMVFHALIAFLFLIPVSKGACPNGTILGLDSSSCYLFVSTPLNWTAAEAFCIQRDAYLTSIQDGFTNNFIAGTVALNASQNYWLGGLVTVTNYWQWIDGSPFVYTYWAPGMPVYNTTGLCISQSHSTAQWFNTTCSTALPYVCKFPVVSNSTQSPTMKPNPCPSEWQYFNQTNKCYAYISGNTFNEARSGCQSYGGDLVSIHSQAENDFVAKLINSNGDSYIGLYSPDQSNSDWQWIDGTSMDFSNWASSEPYQDCGTEYCGVLRSPSSSCSSYKDDHWVAEACTQDNPSCHNCPNRLGGVCKLNAI